MARVFVTGSSDGLGLMAGQLLVEQGHAVVLHARNAARANDTKRKAPKAEAVVTGDFASMAQVRDIAGQVNAIGPFDAIIHNAAVGYQESRRVETEDGLPHVFAINVMAPYLLTALIARPKRLVYLSSGMHLNASAQLDDLTWNKRRWRGAEAYAESKLYDTVLAFALARSWPDVLSNAVEPGWVPTKMGGAGAPDDLDLAHRTQAWLATSNDAAACVTGAYFHHQRQRTPNPVTRDIDVQERFLRECERLSGTAMPRG